MTAVHPFPICVCVKCGPPWRQERPEPPESDWMARMMWRSYMPLCPACGNKRCPGAADHNNDCTGSNEPGQAGSVYA